MPDECPAGKATLRVPGRRWGGGRAGNRYSGVLEEVQVKQAETFNFEILRVFVCKMNWILSFHFIDLAIFLSPDFYSKVTNRRYMLFTEYLVCAEHCTQPLPRVVYPEVTVCSGCRYFSSITDGAAQAWSEKRTAPEVPQLGHRPWQPALFHSGFPSIPFSPEPLLTHVHWKMSLPSSARS